MALHGNYLCGGRLYTNLYISIITTKLNLVSWKNMQNNRCFFSSNYGFELLFHNMRSSIFSLFKLNFKDLNDF
jgi:hypothetical protein